MKFVNIPKLTKKFERRKLWNSTRYYRLTGHERNSTTQILKYFDSIKLRGMI